MQTKTLLLAGAAALVGATNAATIANAADMPVRKASPPPFAPAPSWTGWYIGGHAGAAWVAIDRLDSDDDIRRGSGRTTGFIGGGQIGYNWQKGNFVYGFEVDGSFVDGKREHTGYEPWSNNLPWLATARARMGVAIGDTMVYGTAGLAFGTVKTKLAHCPNGCDYYSQSKSRVGWAAGGGVEHMMTRNWSIALEVLHVDLGAKTYCTKDCSTRKVTGKANIGRVKANFRF